MPVAIAIFPEVAVTPPKFSVPVCGIPFSLKNSYSPNGTCHKILPLFKFKAVSVPHGGFDNGYPLSSRALLKLLIYLFP